MGIMVLSLSIDIIDTYMGNVYKSPGQQVALSGIQQILLDNVRVKKKKDYG